MENMYDISEVEDARGANPHKYKAPFYPLAASPMMVRHYMINYSCLVTLSVRNVASQLPRYNKTEADILKDICSSQMASYFRAKDSGIGDVLFGHSRTEQKALAAS